MSKTKEHYHNDIEKGLRTEFKNTVLKKTINKGIAEVEKKDKINPGHQLTSKY